MAAFADINILERGDTSLMLSWETDPASTVASFELYVSTDPTGASPVYTALGALIPNMASGAGYAPRSVVVKVLETDIRALGGVFATVELSISPLYFRAVTVTAAGVRSPVATAKTKALQTLVSAPGSRLGSIHGASFVTTNPLNDDNISIDRVIVGGNVTQETIYLAGAPSGSRAKRIDYVGPFSTDGKATTVRMYDYLLP